MEIILGSQSPRRKEIMNFFSLPFRQISSKFDEEAIEFKGDPISYVHTLSKGKANALASSYPHDIILTADTVVYRKGKVYNKPANEAEAFQTLKELVGKWHRVYTGLTLRKQDQTWQCIEETRVLFNLLTDDQIHHYYRTLPYSDKAGGYMIQEAGSIIVKRIDGCYYNTVGLPINALRTILKKVGIDLWDYLKS